MYFEVFVCVVLVLILGLISSLKRQQLINDTIIVKNQRIISNTVDGIAIVQAEFIKDSGLVDFKAFGDKMVEKSNGHKPTIH